MSYTEYLRRKEAAAPKVIDTTLRLDASSYTQRVKFASSRVLNEVNLRTVEQTDVLPTVSTIAPTEFFINARDIVTDPSGLNMYVTQNSNVIRRIVLATGVVSTFAGIGTAGNADGAGLSVAQFNDPQKITIDPAGLNLYVVDMGNHKIRKIEIATRVVSTLAGIGTAGNADGAGLTTAQFNSPTGICIDPVGLNLYICDRGSHRIRKIEISTGVVSTVAGTTQGFADGAGLSVAQFFFPRGITIDPVGLNLYVTDQGNYKIRKIVISSGLVSTVAGTTQGSADGAGLTVAQFTTTDDIVIDSTNTNLYVSDLTANNIRRIQISTAIVSTIPDINVSTTGLFLNSTDLILYFVDATNYRIKRLTPISAFTLFTPIIPINKLKTGGRIADASAFTQYAGGQAVGKEVQAGMPARRLLLNSNSAGSLTGCRIVPEPVPYNPAVGGVYTANMVRRDASQFTRDETACRELTGEPHNRNELGPSLFVDNTIVGVKNYNLPQNNSKTYTATKCTQCGNNGSQIGKTCSFCIGANHLHPADKPTNNRWGPRPKKSAQPIIVNQSPSDFHKVGAAMRKIPYVEKHHANPQIGHIVYPKTPYRIPRGTAAQLKINDPQRYPGTM